MNPGKKLLLAIWNLMLLPSLVPAQIPPEDVHKIEQAIPQRASAQPKQTRKLLIFTRAEGYKHSSIPYAAKAMELMGKQTGAFTTMQSEDMAVFAPENLKQFDAVLLVNTSELAFEDLSLRQSLMEFVKSGKGMVGIHAATDNFYNWPEAADMMGGHFEGHPWHANGTWAIKIADPTHPLTAAFHGKNFQISDEIYRIRQRSLRQNCRVLVALDMADKTNRAAEGVRFGDRDMPISWVRRFGNGRVFYSSFGHNHSVYWNPAILPHYLDGIQFALGDLPVDTTPLPFEVETSFAPDELNPLFEKIAVYEYGESREPLMNLTEYFRLAAVSPKLQQQNEKRLLQILSSNATLAGKQFICERLSRIGSKESVPALAKMLQDSTTSDMARFALERIPDPAVDKALRKTLSQTTGKIRIGIINTIGQRRDAKAVTDLSKLVENSDPLTAAAAITALGKIGGKKAAQTLAAAKDKTSGELKALVCNAYLNCADMFLQQGGKDQALLIYAQLNAPQFTEPIRYAAMRGMVRARGENVSEFILGLLINFDAATQVLAANLVNEIPAKESIAGIAQALPNFAPMSQVQLLTSLTERRDAEVRQAAMAATQSEHAEVRAAALQALGKIGDETTVPLLAKIAAGKSAEATMARKSLYRLAGPNIDETIVSNIANAVPDLKVELILAVNQRRISAATPLLLQTAKSPESQVRLESTHALKTVANEQHLPDLVELLVNAPNPSERSELEKTVVAVALKAPPEKRNSALVRARLEKFPAGTNSEVRESLLQVLGGIGDRAALPILLAALNDTSANVKTAAIRGLSEWPTAEPSKNLLVIAEKSKHNIHQILALRGFVRLLRFESDLPSEDTVSKFRRAMELAANSIEQKMVLGWLAEVRALSALAAAAAYMKNETLRPDAAVAAVKIAAAVSGVHPVETKTILQQVLQNAKNDTMAHALEARALIEQIDRFEDYMTAWLVSGPYINSEVNLFEYAFPPEQTGQSNIKWQVMPASTIKEAPWFLQLDKVLGGENRVAYLQNRLWSDNEQRVKMELGSDDGVKVWLNGELVHANNASRGVTPGDDIIEITLRQGWNPLLLKIIQGTGGWGACVRLRNLDGSKVHGVKTALFEQVSAMN
ncbi:ThuA domain-containing protein [candidate division KSB1 bacterium]|nr:ThuA domain-containing protein [candidate division KSB1 bacterium]